MTAAALFQLIQPTDLITAISGKTYGVRWTIETVMERRPAYRLFVAGTHIATLASPGAARELRDEFILDCIGQTMTAVVQTAAGIEG